MRFDKLYTEGQEWLMEHGSRLIISIIILFVGLKLIKVFSRRLRGRMDRKQVHSSLRSFFLSLFIIGLYVLLIILVMNINGYEMSVFTGILSAFTVAIGFALSGTFQNFAGGVLILILKPFVVNDSILAQGQEGTVTSIQIFYTVLLSVDNKTIIIPNGKLFNEVIVNYTREGKRRLDFEVKLAYAADIAKAKQIITDAVIATSNIYTDMPVRVGVVGLEIDSIRITVNVWLDPTNYLAVKIALMEKILTDLAAAQVPFPKAG